MIAVARLLVGAISFLLLVALALIGFAVAVSAIDPSGVTGWIGLPELRDSVGDWFDDLEASGPVAPASALGGGAAILLGLLLLVGLLIPRRERLVTLDTTSHGTLSARRRALAQVATHLVEQTRGVAQARVKVSPRRRTGGRLRVRAQRPRPTPASETKAAITSQLEELTGPFKLKASVQTRVGDRGSRVQ